MRYRTEYRVSPDYAYGQSLVAEQRRGRVVTECLGDGVALDFSIQRGTGFVLVDVHNEIDIASTSDLKAIMVAFDRSDPVAVIVDLTKCTFVDARCLDLFAKQRRDEDNLLLVLPPNHRLHHTFEICGLHRQLRFLPTRERAYVVVREARDHFKGLRTPARHFANLPFAIGSRENESLS